MPNSDIRKILDNPRPGVLSKNQLIKLCEESVISGVSDSSVACGLSAIDLHISSECWEMKGGSIKPHGDRYNTFLQKSDWRKTPNDDGLFELDREKTYVFKIIEKLQLGAGNLLHGQATAKSTIGRTDVLARLIVDGESKYEGFDNKSGNHDMYLEVTPITFNVNLMEGISLSQLRLFYGDPELSKVNNKELPLYGEDILSIPGRDKLDDLRSLSVDLSNIEVGGETGAAFSAKTDLPQPFDLWKKENESDKPAPKDFWDLKKSENNRFLIDNNAFYILRSIQRISMPPHLAVYCKAMDKSIGEMRIHYAGFVHPYFGTKRSDDKKGTPLIFEVRGHNVNVSLGHEEILAKLEYYRMSEIPEPEKEKGYMEQELELSKIFQEWPMINSKPIDTLKDK